MGLNYVDKGITLFNLTRLKKAFELILYENKMHFNRVYVLYCKNQDEIHIYIETKDRTSFYKLITKEVYHSNMLLLAEQCIKGMQKLEKVS